MSNNLVDPNNIKKIENIFHKFLNRQDRSDLGISSGSGVRTSGDKIQKIISQQSPKLLVDYGKNFIVQDSRKSVYNFAFDDISRPITFYVNTVTHRIETKFNMPNITSVDRLQKLYERENFYFIILLISYKSTKQKDFVTRVDFKPIEYFTWDSLGIGALGSGQLQIRNVKNIEYNLGMNRKSWMIEFSDKLKDFYIDEAKKTVRRIEKAGQLKKIWMNK